jgi:hypothetical protein
MRPLFRAGLLLGALVLAACDKDAIQLDELTAPLSGARVKFFNFGMSTPAVNFYANDNKVSALLSATGVESTVGVAYGSVAAGNLYTGIPAGSYTFSGRIAAAVDKDLPIAAIPGTIEAGRAYSVYLAGVYDAAAKRVDGFMVQDQFPDTFDFSRALVRFVNASPNAQPMVLVARNPTTGEELPVGTTPIAFKAGGAFVGVPQGSYDISIRTAGSTTNVVTRTAVSFLAGRVYSITLRGDMTISPTGTAVNRPFLDNSLNR